MSIEEYHARQQANAAANQRSRSSGDKALIQRSVQEIRAHVEKAISLLDGETNAEATAQLQRALEMLVRIR